MITWLCFYASTEIEWNSFSEKYGTHKEKAWTTKQCIKNVLLNLATNAGELVTIWFLYSCMATLSRKINDCLFHDNSLIIIIILIKKTF